MSILPLLFQMTGNAGLPLPANYGSGGYYTGAGYPSYGTSGYPAYYGSPGYSPYGAAQFTQCRVGCCAC